MLNGECKLPCSVRRVRVARPPFAIDDKRIRVFEDDYIERGFTHHIRQFIRERTRLDFFERRHLMRQGFVFADLYFDGAGMGMVLLKPRDDAGRDAGLGAVIFGGKRGENVRAKLTETYQISF